MLTFVDLRQDALSLDPTKFIQLQLKVANRLGDHARAIRLQIQLKGACPECAVCRVRWRRVRSDGRVFPAELFFAQFKKMFVLHEWKRLRDPDSFAKTKMFGRETLRRVRLPRTEASAPPANSLTCRVSCVVCIVRRVRRVCRVSCVGHAVVDQGPDPDVVDDIGSALRQAGRPAVQERAGFHGRQGPLVPQRARPGPARPRHAPRATHHAPRATRLPPPRIAYGNGRGTVGLSTHDIRDEIYCQIIKQLTDNDNHMSMEKVSLNPIPSSVVAQTTGKS